MRLTPNAAAPWSRWTRRVGSALFLGSALVLGSALANPTFVDAQASSAVPQLPIDPFDYNAPLPGYYTGAGLPPFVPPFVAAIDHDNTPATNPITDEGATLGRVLFYDKALSANGTTSCASCHPQANGFADPNPVSTGFMGGLTSRNSMGLTNARFYAPGSFFWDERAATLEDQVLMPFLDPIEMGNTLPQLLTTVEDRNYYAPLFTDAFGDSNVTADRIAAALAQFIRSIVSVDSKYDAGRAAAPDPFGPFVNFTPQENDGKFFFDGFGCSFCHRTEAFNNPEFGATSNGLDLASTVDLGVGGFTGLPGDVGTFKVPSLRNIAVTAPYMHDGRFATLDDVLDFYSTGIQAHPNLDPFLMNPPDPSLPPGPVTLNMTQGQKDAIIAFLGTLTDPVVNTHPKFSDPFVEASFVRGDLDLDGSVALADAIQVLAVLFLAANADCEKAADIDDDGALALGDAISLLGHLFASGAPPAEPFASCGSDPSPDGLGCELLTCP